MTHSNQKYLLFDRAPIYKALLMMGIPTMLGMLINAFYNLIDAYFVSGLGEFQVAAVSITYPIGQFLIGIGLLFGNGAASYIARLLGRHKEDQANRTASTALYGGLIVGTGVMMVILFFLKPVLLLSGASQHIMPYALSYAAIYLFACIFNIFNVIMNSLLTCEGNAKAAMFILLTGTVLNSILDPILIYTLHIGVSGAAIATVIAQIVSAILYFAYIQKGHTLLHFRMQKCTFSKEILAEIFKIGIPILIFQLLTSLSITLTNQQAAHYGESTVAALGIVTRLMAIGSLAVFGFIKGFQPIAGYNYGSGNIMRLKKIIKTALLWSTLFCIISALFLVFFAKPIILQFSFNNSEMAVIGTRALQLNGITFILFGVYTVYSSLFLALGKGLQGFILGACRQGIFFIPIILIFPSFWGINGILYTQPIADILSFILTLFMSFLFHHQIRKNKSDSILNKDCK